MRSAQQRYTQIVEWLFDEKRGYKRPAIIFSFMLGSAVGTAHPESIWEPVGLLILGLAVMSWVERR